VAIRARGSVGIAIGGIVACDRGTTLTGASLSRHDDESIQRAQKWLSAHFREPIDVDVALGTIVKLVPPFGGTLEAEVNGSWTDELDGKKRIGVKLLDADGWFAE